MKKKHVAPLLLVFLFVGLIVGYMFGKFNERHFSSKVFPYTQCVNIGKLVIFSDDEGSNFLITRRATQDGKTGVRWILSEETTDEGRIHSTWYGPNSPLVTKNPMCGPISDWIGEAHFISPDTPTPIFCQLGKFPSSSIFKDKNNDGLWDTWHDGASGKYYHYNIQKMCWEETE